MEEKVFNIDFQGLNLEPKALWDILFYSAVKMQIEHDAYGTDEDRRRWLMYRIKLAEEIMMRIPFEGKGIIEDIEE